MDLAVGASVPGKLELVDDCRLERGKGEDADVSPYVNNGAFETLIL